MLDNNETLRIILKILVVILSAYVILMLYARSVCKKLKDGETEEKSTYLFGDWYIVLRYKRKDEDGKFNWNLTLSFIRVSIE